MLEDFFVYILVFFKKDRRWYIYILMNSGIERGIFRGGSRGEVWFLGFLVYYWVKC